MHISLNNAGHKLFRNGFKIYHNLETKRAVLHILLGGGGEIAGSGG